MSKKITVEKLSITEDQLADAFTEWERRYREDPGHFKSTVSRLLKTTPYQYGKACALYLLEVIQEQLHGHEKKTPGGEIGSTQRT